MITDNIITIQYINMKSYKILYILQQSWPNQRRKENTRNARKGTTAENTKYCCSVI